MKAKQWVASLFFPILTTGFAVFAYVWESLQNSDWSVRYAFRGGYIAFAAIGLLAIILTCALKINTSEYFLPRIVIFGITQAAVLIVIVIAESTGDTYYWSPGLFFLILLASIISTQVMVFRKYASPREWLICLFANPVFGAVRLRSIDLARRQAARGIGILHAYVKIKAEGKPRLLFL